MNNIIRISFFGIRPPADVIFKNKLLTIILSPFSNIIFLIVLLIILLIMIIVL